MQPRVRLRFIPVNRAHSMEPPQNTRRNTLPVKFIDGAFVMRREYLASAVVELMQIRETSSGTNRVLQHAPKAFDGIEVMATMGRQEMEAKLVVVVLKGGVELVRSVEPAPIDDHHDLFAGGAEGGHHLVDILAQLLRIKVRDDFIEDFGGAVLDGAQHTEQHAARDTAPGAIAHPRLAFEGFVALDLALAQRTGGQTRALGTAPPAQPGEGKAPQDGFIFIEQNALSPARPILQGSEVD
jgi:hypothetical protein